LLDTLKAELAAVHRFIDILQQEQTALVSADVDTLLTLADRKIKQSDELRLLAQQRVNQLSQAGYSGDREGMDAWLMAQAAPARKDLKKSWDDLLLAGRTAQRLNETNGKLIETHLQHNQQALAALANAANQSSVYGRDGQPHTTIPLTSRTLGKV
jgi:flagella synthesis protein FlgN